MIEGVVESPLGKAYPQFDGTAYATIPAWTPSSARWSVAFVCHPATDEVNALTGSAGGTSDYIATFTAPQRLGAKTGGGSPVYITPAGGVVGRDVSGRLDVYADGYTLTAFGQTSGKAALGANTPVWGLIGANDSPTNLFDGSIKSLQLIDHTPLQGIRAMGGNGTDRYAAIPEITLAGDFEIEFWWERQDRTGANSSALIGNSGIDAEFLAVFDSGHGSIPDALAVNVSGAQITFAGALADIDQGQSVRIGISRAGADVEGFVDGVSVGIAQDSAAFSINQLLRQGGLNFYARSPIANLRIHDLETGDLYTYDNRNDSGNLLVNTNPATAEGEELANVNTVTLGASSGDGWQREGDTLTNDVAYDGYINTGIYTSVGELYKIEVEDVSDGIRVGTEGGTVNATPVTAGATYKWGGGAQLQVFGQLANSYIKGLSIRKVTHGLWHQSGTVMTNAAADAARTYLPLISRHYLCDTPGRIREVLGNTADATLVNLDASGWQPE